MIEFSFFGISSPPRCTDNVVGWSFYSAASILPKGSVLHQVAIQIDIQSLQVDDERRKGSRTFERAPGYITDSN